MRLRLRGSTVAPTLVLAIVLSVRHAPRAAANPAASGVLGQLDFSHNAVNILGSTGLLNPLGVAVDRSVTPNRLYVADLGNHRVLGWRSIERLANGAPADLVIGQKDFLSWSSQCNSAAVSAATLCAPLRVAVDGGGNVYVTDGGNNRVLEYDDPFDTDTLPERVFGQDGSFTSSACNKGGSISAATLCNPNDLAVDSAGNLYIADTDNSRVLEFDNPLRTDARADRVWGQHGSFSTGACNRDGLSASSLCRPTILAVDSLGNLYVGDSGNLRVLAYVDPLGGNTAANLVFAQPDFETRLDWCAAQPGRGTICKAGGLALDSADNLYLTGVLYSRIQVYENPLGTGNTTPVAVLGQPNFNSEVCNYGGVGPASLCLPFGVKADGADELFVADSANHRVLELIDPIENAKGASAIVALGQSSLDRNGVNQPKANSLYGPRAVAVDFSTVPNRLYVADTNNSRVLGWRRVPAFEKGAPADLVIGQPDFLSTGCNQNRIDAAGNSQPAADTLCQPGGVAVDAAGNLYVADSNNFRVLEYKAPFSSGKTVAVAATRVFGQQGSFSTRIRNLGGVSAASLAAPAAVALDAAGNLYVADPQNNRVLEYDHADASDTIADAVFGQGGSFTANACNFDGSCDSSGCFTSADALCGPTAVAIDDIGRLYIADTGNNRALIFDTPLAPAKVADLVIGQVDFRALNCNGLCAPQGLAVNREALFIANTGRSAVNQYDAPVRSSMPPSAVIGAEQCAQDLAGDSTFCGVSGLALDASAVLYAADTFNNRVMEFALAPTPTAPRTLTPTATPAGPTPIPSPTPSAGPTSTPAPAPPLISAIPPVIRAGASFTIDGSGFTPQSVVNFFVATAAGSINTGPFTPLAFSASRLTVAIPSDNPLGQGVAAVQVVNTGDGFVPSNLMLALLQGNPAAAIPSISAINGTPIASDSTNPAVAVANVETVVPQGHPVTLDGAGFDATNGVAVDLYCACPAGKVGPFLLNPGDPGLTSTRISLPVPSSGPQMPATGPGAFVVTNKGADGSFTRQSNSVSVPIGQKITVTSVNEADGIVMVSGTGFSTATVINFFNLQGGSPVNLGGLKPNGSPRIPLNFIDQTRISFVMPAAATRGPGYVQALNPPFIPFTSSGNGAGGAFRVE